ncbi:type VII secretion integral membrane protein EccD [Streptomyces sp. SP17BM10]|uniref:type VII secretion integral membrane protein EccD n=1 Tax=Streptomyces sp. SP17BM10 TaxID=3002530 RepID=UPI002E7A566C|nr:type VII secretion integral membrane protein EccD [Streptomyces sp. SP17BM10]MEE1782621.1 type VII secretion integral membrane protein EccD [Streptomyces sp. SP17BM10]
MSTPAPAGAPPVTEVCRLTVVHADGRFDVSVPVSTPISALLPVLLGRLTLSPQERGAVQVLQRLGEDPLDPDGTPESLGLKHGDVLHLRPAEAALPALHFDDVADGVAQVIGGRADRWQPVATVRLALTAGAVLLAVLAAALLSGGPGPLTAATTGVSAAGLLVAACLVGARPDARRGTVLTAAVGAIGLAALSGFTFRGGPDHAFLLRPAEVLMGALATAVVCGVLLIVRPLPFLLPGTALLTAAAAAAAAGLVHAAHWDAAQALAVVAVALFVLGQLGPRLALRLAGVKVPALPHDAEELQQDITPEPQARLERAAGAANDYLDALALASAVLYAAAFWFLVREPGWINWALPLVLAGAVLLRSRGLTGVLQRVSAVLAGTLGLALLLLAHASHGTAARILVPAVLLAAALLLLVRAPRLTDRLLPIWGHTGDILETATVIALLPLVLQALHVYSALRVLAS